MVRIFSQFAASSCVDSRSEISREMYHARLSGVPNDVALNHCGQSGTEHFVCISSADGTDYAVTVKFRVHELRRWNRFRSNCSVCTQITDGSQAVHTWRIDLFSMVDATARREPFQPVLARATLSGSFRTTYFARNCARSSWSLMYAVWSPYVYSPCCARSSWSLMYAVWSPYVYSPWVHTLDEWKGTIPLTRPAITSRTRGSTLRVYYLSVI